MKLWARQLALGLLLTAAIPPAAVRAADSADQILLEKANYWRLKDRPDLARDALDKLLSANPLQPDALYAYGVLELQQGDVAGARGYLLRLRQAAPTDPRVASLEVSLAGGHTPAAAAPVQSAADNTSAKKPAQAVHPTPAPAEDAMAAAARTYQQAVAASPKNPLVRLDYARFLASRGQAAQGFATVDPAASGNTPAALYAAAIFDNEQHRPADALAKLDRIPAAQRSADMTKLRADIAAPATIEHAKMLTASGKGAEAKALLAAAPSAPGSASVAQLEPRAKASPNDPKLQSALGHAYADAGQYPQAAQAFAAAYRLDPKNPDALAALIDATIQDRDTVAAGRYLGAGLAAYPKDPRFLGLEAKLAQAAGNSRPAQKSLTGSSAAPPQAAGSLAAGAGSSEPPPLSASADSADVSPARSATRGAAPVQMASLPSSGASDGDLSPDATTSGSGGKRTQVAQLELDVPGPVPIAAAQAWKTPPANPNAPQQQDSLQLDIEQSINQIESENNPTLEGGFVYRGRFGTSGLSQLNELAAPFDLTFAPWWTGKMTVSMSPVWLDSGDVGGSSLPLFGANQTLVANGFSSVVPGEQGAFGALGSIAYAYGDFSGKIGESAWGFPVVNWIGNVAYNPKFLNGQLSAKLEGFREPVTDSLLSYAGTHANLAGPNALTGNAFGNNGTWGGVVKSGVRGSLFYDDTEIGAYGIVNGEFLTGTNVAQNSEIGADIGAYFRPWRTDTQAIRVGINLNYSGFDKNLSFYTFGQGGYFSPQNYIGLTFPVEWQGTQDKWSWLAAVGLGIQHFNASSSAFYPNNPWAQTQLELAGAASGTTTQYSGTHSTGLAADVRGQIEYAVAKDLSVGAAAQYDNGNDYNEGIVKVYFRKTFAAPPPVAPILPGTPSGGPAESSPPPAVEGAPAGVAPGAPTPVTPPPLSSPPPAAEAPPAPPPPAPPGSPPQSAG
ncbi:MAG TPA: cellulose synthase subunit BcsC-related outer membrane protein [Stellaceae bacterium]|jgi:cytochrome c-type biogenesis protein CcmH/NrfG